MKGWTPQAAARASRAISVPAERRTPAPAPTEPQTRPASLLSQEITFPGKVPGNNGAGGLLRLHWRARLTLQLNYLKRVYAAGLRRCPGSVRMELVRYSTGRQMDFDNLVSTGKHLIDALVKAQIIADDTPDIICERSYTQERVASKAEQRTVLRLIPL